MKTPEDEAFDDLARKQGGGFMAKRAMAAGKLREPAQEPVGTLNISCYKGHLVNHDFDYFGELPDGTYSVYTTPPQREWVGLTDEERQDIALEVLIDAVLIIEAKLKERNS